MRINRRDGRIIFYMHYTPIKTFDIKLFNIIIFEIINSNIFEDD